jgi:hypothetical protein
MLYKMRQSLSRDRPEPNVTRILSGGQHRKGRAACSALDQPAASASGKSTATTVCSDSVEEISLLFFPDTVAKATAKIRILRGGTGDTQHTRSNASIFM